MIVTGGVQIQGTPNGAKPTVVAPRGWDRASDREPRTFTVPRAADKRRFTGQALGSALVRSAGCRRRTDRPLRCSLSSHMGVPMPEFDDLESLDANKVIRVEGVDGQIARDGDRRDHGVVGTCRGLLPSPSK